MKFRTIHHSSSNPNGVTEGNAGNVYKNTVNGYHIITAADSFRGKPIMADFDGAYYVNYGNARDLKVGGYWWSRYSFDNNYVLTYDPTCFDLFARYPVMKGYGISVRW